MSQIFEMGDIRVEVDAEFAVAMGVAKVTVNSPGRDERVEFVPMGEVADRIGEIFF
jgi:hypothetical protein